MTIEPTPAQLAERLQQRLELINKRIQDIADEEAKSAWVGGLAAQGALMPEKMRLLKQAEEIVDRLEELLKKNNDRS
ncbi:hypothetical protein [Chthonobacter rhizosphaerae]|uniref:hypothetical protein n=1 Tax=Chthonobacter rhizosphaerae TaxID=2735553 RepID=UPI0015EE4D96|nr:hypothetical protein [Chthonobacter rhizosphaerae]